MSHDTEETHRQLDNLIMDGAKGVTELDLRGTYVIFSDLHLGNGRSADDFRDNERVLQHALDHYNNRGFTLVLLGDVEEFWQFDLRKIKTRYEKTIYNSMSSFRGDRRSQDRVVRVWGNHDSEWGCPVDPVLGRRRKGEPEAVLLVEENSNNRILLVHGHQGSNTSDKHSWISRFVVRGLFKPIEGIARRLGYGQREATKSQVTKKYEKAFYSWAVINRIPIVCGHSHRAIFASRSYADRLEEKISEAEEELLNENNGSERGRIRRRLRKYERDLEKERNKGRDLHLGDPDRDPVPCYFNTGCGLYSDGVTAIEIEGGNIRLVKWDRNSLDKDQRFNSSQADLDAVLTAVDQGQPLL